MALRYSPKEVAVLLGAIGIFSLSSCDTIGMSPAQATMNSNASMQVTCTAGDDCERKWANALDWVQRNSHWKLRNVTDTLITTEGPFDTTYAAFEITRFPLGNGQYELRFRAACGNMFGCVPSIKQLQADFNVSVGYTDMSGQRSRPQPPSAVAPQPPAPAQPVTQQPATRGATDFSAFDVANAASVPVGTSAEEARRLIGRDPDRREQVTVDGVPRELWFYSYPQQKVTITFRSGKVSDVSVQK